MSAFLAKSARITAYARLLPLADRAMPYSRDSFKVIVTLRKQGTPVTYAYGTKEEAMRAANGFRSTLYERAGGQIIVQDPDGKELQTWVEHPIGPHFTHHGGFQV